MYGKARTGIVCGSYRASFYHGAKIRNSAVLSLAGNLLGSAFPKPCYGGLRRKKISVRQAVFLRELPRKYLTDQPIFCDIIADAAARYFKAHGITRLPARKALQDEIEQLVSKKSGLYNTYHAQKQRFRELQTVKRNIDQILRREEPRRRKEQSHER